MVANDCLWFIFGINKREHLFHKLADTKWLKMEKNVKSTPLTFPKKSSKTNHQNCCIIKLILEQGKDWLGFHPQLNFTISKDVIFFSNCNFGNLKKCLT